MNNPNSRYTDSPTANPNIPAAVSSNDPVDDPNFDWMRWMMSIDFRPPAEIARERAIRQWLESAGFTAINLRRVPERGEDCWQAVMRRGTNRDCPTGLAAQSLMEVLAADLGCRIDGESAGLAWDDQIGVGFRLSPAA
jgi:hypothetical protein